MTTVPDRRLQRHEIADAAEPIGWRLILGSLRTAARVPAGRGIADTVGAILAAVPDTRSLGVDVRGKLLLLSLQSPDLLWVTDRELRSAAAVTRALAAAGVAVDAGVGELRGRKWWRSLSMHSTSLQSDHSGEPSSRTRTSPATSPIAAWWIRWGRALRCGFSRWTHRGRSATEYTST